jgi:S-DNA-T family DNA segregation ATPase FtsK/SpoIIIE
MIYLYLVVALAVLGTSTRYGLGPTLVRAAFARDRELARSCWHAARIRRRWRSLARALSLVLPDRAHQGPLGSSPEAAPGVAKYRAPRLLVRPDPYGVRARLRTVPSVGLADVQRQADYLADAWRCVRVAVTQHRPGWVEIRAVRRDPLAVPTSYVPDARALSVPADLSSVEVGTDEYAEPVSLRLSGVSGVTVAGLPGYGKTSFLLGLVARLAPSPAVQFVIFDGKTENPSMEGDWADVADRCAVMVGDDLEAANDVLTRLNDLRRARSRSIRPILGTVNMWHDGPASDWPLIVVIVDEAQSYFRQVKTAPKTPQAERNRLADENAQLTEDLVKKGRSVGFLVILATQKQTGDAIPTFIRDVCAVSLAFACRTVEAAKAALGEDIKDYPDANPVALQDPCYIGVATMAVEGRPGFTRVRMPYVPADVAAAVATATSALCGRRGELPHPVLPAMIGTDDDDYE